jgi:hypothetical protein
MDPEGTLSCSQQPILGQMHPVHTFPTYYYLITHRNYRFIIPGCNQKFPDWVDNEINNNNNNNNKHSLRSNIKGYGNKTRWTDSQNSDTTAPSGRELYHLQFSLRAASPETFRYTLVLQNSRLQNRCCQQVEWISVYFRLFFILTSPSYDLEYFESFIWVCYSVTWSKPYEIWIEFFVRLGKSGSVEQH